VTERPFVLNGWTGAAAVLVGVALVSVIYVLSGPYSATDSKIFYSLGAALLGGSTFFAALELIERGSLVGYAGLVAAPVGFLFLTYAIWQEATSSTDANSEFYTGIVLLVTALLAVTAQLLADSAFARVLAAAASGVALLAAGVSLLAGWQDEQFWRVGTTITCLWIVAVALYFLVPIAELTATRSVEWLAAAPVVFGPALAGVFALVAGGFSPQGYQIVFTLIAAVLAASALLGGVVLLDRGVRVLGWIAVALSPLAFVLFAEGIWHESDDRSRFISTAVALSLALLVSVAARLFAVTDAFLLVAGAAAVLAAASAVISINGIWNDDRYFLTERTTTALWILATLCCLLVPILERSRTESEPELSVA
jgi:hypothetical protein